MAKTTFERIKGGHSVAKGTFKEIFELLKKTDLWARHAVPDYRDLMHPDEWPRVGYAGNGQNLPSGPSTEDSDPPEQEPIAEVPVPAPTVSLAKLGPFLKDYSDLIKLDVSTVAENYLNRKPETPDWAPGLAGDKEDVGHYLQNVFYAGKNPSSVPFDELGPLLNAFTDPRDELNLPELAKDIPSLTAEWLCALPSNAPFLHLPYDKFSPPVGETHANKAMYGVKTTYRNAPLWLDGLDCAFVRFELKGNTPAPPSLHGDRTDIGRVTELLKNLWDEDAVKDIPHSRLHVHPGDELIVVTSGTIYVQLENTGVWTPLQAGDFIHFNAEIPHSVWNVYPEGASALIIRFFQLNRHSTRVRQTEALQKIQQLMRQLSDDYPVKSKIRLGLLSQLESDFPTWVNDTKHTYFLWSHIAPWVHDRTRRPQDRLRTLEDSSKVQDLVGLSRFLLTYISELSDSQVKSQHALLVLRDAVRELEQANVKTDLHIGYKRLILYKKALGEFVRNIFGSTMYTKVLSCFEGLPIDPGALPDTETLREIARILRMPRVLLDGYLSPNALRVAVVRGAQAKETSNPLDWVQPLSGSRGNARHANYFLPSRALANSDMSVVLLDLDAHGYTDWNWHPGFELVMPISGRVRVELRELGKGTPTSSDECDKEGILIYRSSIEHRVVQVGDVSARVLVVRFNIPSCPDAPFQDDGRAG